MIEYTVAAPGEYEKCLDFGNFVFSQAHVPHDFRALLPKTYGSEENFAGVPHFIAKREDGYIRAMIACRPTPLKYLDTVLTTGYVGTVSVHPYARGEGHMKQLMADMIADGRKRGYDMLVLGGQRQRYGYFGFEKGGVALRFDVSSTNLRHTCKDLDVSRIAFREMTEADAEQAWALHNTCPVGGVRRVEDFVTVMHSWNQKAYVILNGGEFAGYMNRSGTELMLKDEELLYAVIKAYYAAFGIDNMSFLCGIHETRRIALLEGLAERWSLTNLEMLSVLNWKNVLNALLKYKAAYIPLTDGEKTLIIEGTPLTIRVENGKPEVCEAANAEGAPVLDHMQAMKLFFRTTDYLLPNSMLPQGWAPLPFYMTNVDGF